VVWYYQWFAGCFPDGTLTLLVPLMLLLRAPSLPQVSAADALNSSLQAAAAAGKKKKKKAAKQEFKKGPLVVKTLKAVAEQAAGRGTTNLVQDASAVPNVLLDTCM
jgi:hypothetical protein